MTAEKQKVLLLFGGKSPEHIASVRSGANIFAALDKEKYEVLLVAIDTAGAWWFFDRKDFPFGDTIIPDWGGQRAEIKAASAGKGRLVLLDGGGEIFFDVVFPALHGPNGEDGRLQGYLDLLEIPYVGCGVLSSSAAMDKRFTKSLLRDAGLNIASFEVFSASSVQGLSWPEISQTLGSPLIIKPANAGSSVGVSRVRNEAEFKEGIEKALRYDTHGLIEEFILGRELECSVLGGKQPCASLVGEVVKKDAEDFYSHEAKIADDTLVGLKVPVSLPESILASVQAQAVRSFQALGCYGLARVDFFLQEDGSLIVNELNTMPGFTSISMYPKLWEAAGLPFSELLNELLSLAFQRASEQRGISYSGEGR